MKKLFRKLDTSRLVLLVASLSLLLMLAVGMTLAYLFDKTESITNTFTPTEVSQTIVEDFDKDVKKDVKVTNTGDIDAYIRVLVVITWQDDGGNVYPTAPVEGTDYTVTWTMDGWAKHTDGFYYYKSKVAPKASTGILLTDCEPVEGKAPEGYHLSVEILSSAIQAQPADAVHDAWGVDISNGTVTDYPPEGGNS